MKRYLIFVFSLLLVVACAPEGKEESKQAEVTEPALDVKLNGNEPWVANDATIVGIEKMTEMVSDFDPSAMSYDILQVKLREEFGLIFKNCTMKGEAHEQLHNYLLPLMDLFGNLTAGSDEERAQTVAAIERHLGRFKNYFEGEAI